MSDNQDLLLQTAEKLFADLAEYPADELLAPYAAIEEAGFPLLLIGEEAGGFGGDWADAVAVFRLAGYHALRSPLAEAVIARYLLAQAGLGEPDGLVTVAATADGGFSDGRFTGSLKGVAWGRHAQSVVATLGTALIHLQCSDAAKIVEGAGPSGHPRDALTYEAAPAVTGDTRQGAFELMALARTAQMAGALDGALMRSIDYANERVQFGKPIGKFQAVQQCLAVFAEEAAAVNCASQAAAKALRQGDAAFEIGAAKLRANIAAGIGSATAHQVHGAIGFTREYGLHRWTRPLAGWSSEFGSERYWAKRLGSAIAARGADQLWPDLVRGSDRD